MSNTYKDSFKLPAYQTIQVPSDVSICIIGDIHEHPEQFFSLLRDWKPSPSKWIISIGDVYDKGYGEKAAETITDELIKLSDKHIAYAVRGNHEVKIIKSKKKEPLTKCLKWWRNRPLVISFIFSDRTITVLHAGVSPLMTKESLGKDIEVIYVRDVDENGKMIPLVWKMIDGVKTLVKSKEGGCSWHEIYDGRFGYIVSGHAAQTDGEAKYYTNSCNLDSGIYDTGRLTGQTILPNGEFGDKLIIEGTAFKPKLNIKY
jgi:predicted phosphodiesterase